MKKRTIKKYSNERRLELLILVIVGLLVLIFIGILPFLIVVLVPVFILKIFLERLNLSEKTEEIIWITYIIILIFIIIEKIFFT